MFPDEGFGEVADRIGNYLATERDDVEGYWPPIPDHWVAYGLAETVQFPERDPDQPLTTAELAYARSQAGLFGGQVRWVSQQAGPWGRLVRGTHIVRGGGYGVVGEALTGLWRVAEADSRLADLRAADRANGRSAWPGSPQDVQRSEPADPRADGAWFVRGVTRMDDQQHATSALLRTMAIVDARLAQRVGRRAVGLAVGGGAGRHVQSAVRRPRLAAARDRARSGRRSPPSAVRSDRSSCSSPRCSPGRCSTRST